jgi:ESS family glutamate:Na+ symporter
MPDIAAMVWGFHVLIGSLLAIPVRRVLDATGAGDALDDGLLSRASGVTVDVATVAALSAVQIAVLTTFWVPIVTISTVGGLATLGACVFLGMRGFARAPFEHVVLWFGMSTGTLPLGMTLLRSIDPELESPAPASAVLGSALAVAGVGPILLVLHPLAIAGSPALALGGAVAWLALTLVGWWWLGGLRWTRAPG